MSDKTAQAQQALAAMILDELQTHERFRLWVEANYQIHIFKNDEDKRFEVKVIEEDLALAQENLGRLVKERLGDAESKIQVVGADVLEKLK